MDPEGINAYDSFFRVGGDSIRAMRLVAMARGKGFHCSKRVSISCPPRPLLRKEDVHRGIQ